MHGDTSECFNNLLNKSLEYRDSIIGYIAIFMIFIDFSLMKLQKKRFKKKMSLKI